MHWFSCFDAGECDAPVIAFSQLSRDPEKRSGDDRPQLADLRDPDPSSRTHMWFVFREEVYKPDEPELSGVADIIVAKRRNGLQEK